MERDTEIRDYVRDKNEWKLSFVRVLSTAINNWSMSLRRNVEKERRKKVAFRIDYEFLEINRQVIVYFQVI